jgi:hypothetical protein
MGSSQRQRDPPPDPEFVPDNLPVLDEGETTTPEEVLVQTTD